MSTITISDIPLDTPAQRLRRTAAAVRVHFTWMGIRKTLTKQQKEEAAEQFGASGEFLSAGKKLVDSKHAAVKRLTEVKGRIASYWKGLTLPYTEPGIRLIRQTDIEAFVHTLEGFRQELADAVEDLNVQFRHIKEDAAQRLGRLFNENDYPTDVRGLFSVEWDFPSVEPPNYLMQLNPEIYAQEQQRVAARFDEAVRLAEQAFIGELADLIEHLTERLAPGQDGERKVFRDSAIGNIREFFDRFRRLNLRSNADLDRVVSQAQELLTGANPKEVRDNQALRNRLRVGMTVVGNQLTGMMQDAPRRKIIRGGQHAVAS